VRAGIIKNRTEWKNRIGSGLGDSSATKLAAATIEHFTRQLEAVDQAIGETIDQDVTLRGRRDLLLSVSGVGETLAACSWWRCRSLGCFVAVVRWSPTRD
jgi:hypothetical protein